MGKQVCSTHEYAYENSCPYCEDRKQEVAVAAPDRETLPCTPPILDLDAYIQSYLGDDESVSCAVSDPLDALLDEIVKQSRG